MFTVVGDAAASRVMVNVPAVVLTSAVYVFDVSIDMLGEVVQLLVLTRCAVEAGQPRFLAMVSAWTCVVPMLTSEFVVVVVFGASDVLLLARSHRNDPMTAAATPTESPARRAHALR